MASRKVAILDTVGAKEQLQALNVIFRPRVGCFPSMGMVTYQDYG